MRDANFVNNGCKSCGVLLADENVLYDAQGNVVCHACSLRQDIVDGKKRLATKVLKVAYAAPVLGLVGFVFNPLCLINLAAISNGLYVLHSLKGDSSEHTAHEIEKAKVAAIAGLALGTIGGVLRVVAIFV